MGMLIEYRYNEAIRGFNQLLLAVRKLKQLAIVSRGLTMPIILNTSNRPM